MSFGETKNRDRRVEYVDGSYYTTEQTCLDLRLGRSLEIQGSALAFCPAGFYCSIQADRIRPTVAFNPTLIYNNYFSFSLWAYR